MDTHPLLQCIVFVCLRAIPTCQGFRGLEGGGEGGGGGGGGGEGGGGGGEGGGGGGEGGEAQNAAAKNGTFNNPVLLPPEVRLIKDLMERYPAVRTLARPLFNPADPVVVSMRLALIQILKFDEKNQAIQVMVWKELKWVDQLLQWDPDRYQGIEEITLPADQIWKPDIILYSHVGNPDVERNADVQLHLFHNGSVIWMPPAVYTSSCMVDMTHFPYDRQICELKFGPWSYSHRKLDLVLSGEPEMDLSNYKVSSQWDVLENIAIRRAYKYDCCPDEFMDITYSLHLKRNAGFHIKMLLLPTLLLSTLVLVIWWIPPQRPDRTTLGMSLFSSFVLLLLVILESSPPTAASHLGNFCCSSIVLITLATILSALVVNLATTKRPMHPTIRKVFIQYLGPKLHACAVPIRAQPTNSKSRSNNCTVTDSNETETQPISEDAIPSGGFEKQQSSSQAEWETVAAVFDRIFFLIYAVVIMMLVAAVFPWPTS